MEITKKVKDGSGLWGTWFHNILNNNWAAEARAGYRVERDSEMASHLGYSEDVIAELGRRQSNSSSDVTHRSEKRKRHTRRNMHT